ncbi:MAG TPA: hypothetical protein VLF42_07535, partial [Burkholderiales bacterium]|nr:hypothetical protein [Burkholderiales bacterium]
MNTLEAHVEARIRSLFARYPMLHGFAVQDRALQPKDLDRDRVADPDLFVTDIGLCPRIESHYDQICDEITVVITDLVHNQPRAYDYLCGRTFARAL